MIFTQYYLDCLSQASYLIGDETTGRAVVVDPRRDIAEYLRDAEANGLRIELVLETHFHADFLSGHLELAGATGATIGYGSAAKAEYPIRAFADGERYRLGEIELEILCTPGHTPESISIVVYEHADNTVPYGVLTGDTLFIGDVGRPDLLASVGVEAGDLAADLYRSLHDKLLSLPDETRVFPAHGAGSACGKNLSTETSSTIGAQRATNYALAPMDVATFIDIVTEGQPPAPGYFLYDASMNKREHDLFDETEHSAALDFDTFETHRHAGAVVIDVRSDVAFAAGHLNRAINVGLQGRFAEYVGGIAKPGSELLVVADDGTEDEAKMRLARIGYDRVLGHLANPETVLIEHPELAARSSRLTATELAARIGSDAGVQLVDVRTPSEFALGTIPNAINIPLPQLHDRADELDANAPTLVFCAGGYRSSAASSLLDSLGFADVSDLLGGYGAWRGVQG